MRLFYYNLVHSSVFTFQPPFSTCSSTQCPPFRDGRMRAKAVLMIA